MTPEDRRAKAICHAIAGLIEAIGMTEENRRRQRDGLAFAYSEHDFIRLLDIADEHTDSILEEAPDGPPA